MPRSDWLKVIQLEKIFSNNLPANRISLSRPHRSGPLNRLVHKKGLLLFLQPDLQLQVHNPPPVLRLEDPPFLEQVQLRLVHLPFPRNRV